MTWQPTASIHAIQARADLYRQIRDFFAERQVMEVDVPVLGEAAAVDVNIESIAVPVAQKQYGEVVSGYLQTSPEFAMKRLLSYGCGSIYYLGKAFRKGEAGSRHNPEFSLLEWYRPGFDDQLLMDEIESFFAVLGITDACRISYREAFEQALGVDPHTLSESALAQLAKRHVDISWENTDRDSWLDLLMSHVVEPGLGDRLVFIYDYPASQAALAKKDVDDSGQLVAKRFEVFYRGLELANGYWELTCATEQEERFQADLNARRNRGLPLYPYDRHLVAALDSGMPESAGVALGVDRLLMSIMDKTSITDVIAFPWRLPV